MASPSDGSAPAPLLCCRALYDFESTDPSALSFRRGDVIQGYNQLESGWWDGVCGGDARGWFPSNYVEIMAAPHATLMTERQDTYASEQTNPASVDSNDDGMLSSFHSHSGAHLLDVSSRGGYFGDYDTDNRVCLCAKSDHFDATIDEPVPGRFSSIIALDKRRFDMERPS